MPFLTIYCADIGSVAKGNFGWARLECNEAPICIVGQDIREFADNIADDLNSNHPVALGFECPLFIPIPDDPKYLTSAREGEGNRAWSAGAGAGSLVTGLSETVWILTRIQRKILADIPIHIRWPAFQRSNVGLFLWEAFVTGDFKVGTHIGDAELAVSQFYKYLRDPEAHNAIKSNAIKSNAIKSSSVRSLIGAALLQSGLTDDLSLLNKPCLVIRVTEQINCIQRKEAKKDIVPM